jgi:hypothetical protein
MHSDLKIQTFKETSEHAYLKYHAKALPHSKPLVIALSSQNNLNVLNRRLKYL